MWFGYYLLHISYHVCIGQNLFEDTCARLESVRNYTVDTLPTEGDVTVANLAFRSIVTASFEETSITVEFDEIYLINELKLEGQQARGVAVQPGKAGDPFCYVVDVSKDEFQWIRVIDYSYLRCYSTQQLYFPKQAVKYVMCFVANTVVHLCHSYKLSVVSHHQPRSHAYPVFRSSVCVQYHIRRQKSAKNRQGLGHVNNVWWM